MGKGDKPRPRSPYVSDEEFERRWERIFGEQPEEPMERVPPDPARPRLRRLDGRIEVHCEHGVGHTTPASARALDKHYGHEPGTWAIHGCDGCCQEPGFFDEEEL